MTTEVFLGHGDRKRVSGKLEKPSICGVYMSEHTFVQVADHREFAVFTYMGRDKYSNQYKGVSIVLDSEHPVLDTATHPQLEHLYLGGSHPRIKYKSPSKRNR
jgi:hypothetical protein